MQIILKLNNYGHSVAWTLGVQDGCSPCFPREVVDAQHFPNPGCEQAWMIPALAGSAGSGAGRERAVGAWRGGRAGPSRPSLCSGRAGLFVSLIYNVLDKCE